MGPIFGGVGFTSIISMVSFRTSRPDGLDAANGKEIAATSSMQRLPRKSEAWPRERLPRLHVSPMAEAKGWIQHLISSTPRGGASSSECLYAGENPPRPPFITL